MGTGNQVQASSSYTALNPFDQGANYGSQPFDYKFLYNLNMYYEVPFFKGQHGVLGHILGGWTIAPLFTAQSGSPTAVSYSEGSCTGCEAFGEVTTPGTSAAVRTATPTRKTPSLSRLTQAARRRITASPAPTEPT